LAGDLITRENDQAPQVCPFGKYAGKRSTDSALRKACLLRVPMPSQRMRLAKGWSASGPSRVQTLGNVPIARSSPRGT